ncbi:hypothetical protein C8Q79DRAFT_1104947 [Trametes meyenii]|nr:hypothetical protein C8Q79DRAFT_1104947 [Trametes meyenii]
MSRDAEVTKKPKQPYDKTRATGFSSAHAPREETAIARGDKGKGKLALQSLPSISTATIPDFGELAYAVETAREPYLEQFHKKYPGITPRDDYDIVRLGSSRRTGTAAELFAWVDEKMKSDIALRGSREVVMESAESVSVSTTDRMIPLNPEAHHSNYQRKPRPERDTIQPVNSPFKFELWVVPDPSAPHLRMPSGRLQSLERNFEIVQDKILPGEEKWVLRDGQTCVIRRPGERDIMFTVPMRKSLKQEQDSVDAHVLEFPKEVDG